MVINLIVRGLCLPIIPPFPSLKVGVGLLFIRYKVLIDPAMFFMLSTGLRIILVTPKPCVVQPPFGIQQLGGMMVDQVGIPKCRAGNVCTQIKTIQNEYGTHKLIYKLEVSWRTFTFPVDQFFSPGFM